MHLLDDHVMMIGGEKGCAATIIYVSLQSIAQKTQEWQHQEQIFRFDGDIYKAFDCLRPSTAAKALRQLKVHPLVIAAWLQENCSLQMRPKLLREDEHLCDYLPYNSLRQGGPDSMKVWNLTIQNAISPLHKKWVREGKGVSFAPAKTLWTHLVWVDGLQLMARTQKDLE